MTTEFAFNVADKVLGQLGSWAYQEITAAWGMQNDLEKLKRTITVLKGVLLDAEEKQTGNRAITDWLQQLKEVLYDAEDVFDKLEVESTRRKVVKRSGFKKKMSHFFSCPNPIPFHFKIAHELKGIRERLEEAAKNKDMFKLNEREESLHFMNREREMTHSFVCAPDIFGREQDKENIIKLLTQKTKDISVIPIVGLGGLGKTALSKLVYNDPMVEKHFEKRIWVCVSDNFNVKRVVVNIIKSIFGKDYSNMEIDVLQIILRDALDGKKYLLVLDDVWEENWRKWLDLITLLMGGASGSKIVVTTLSKKVASIVGTIPDPYELEGLPYEDCLKLFFKHALRDGEQQQYPKLQEIGGEIVRKCKGVPLAIITLATHLRSTIEEREWKNVRDSELWRLEQNEDDILPALRLSYEKLPSYLKRCFAYCSIYPKDFDFADVQLVAFWIAHGLVQLSNGSTDYEDVGHRYFKELVSRGFFQDVEDMFSAINCKMHDLMHDLALSVLQTELLITPSNNKQEPTPKSVRHLCGKLDPKLLTQDLLANLDHVRAVYFESPDNDSINHTCFPLPRSQYVRILNLRESKFEMLPKEIFSLKHLRYLDLVGSDRIRQLPHSICNLYNLQTLLLGGCENLEELPKDMKYMVSLRMLVLTTKQVRLPNDGIGSLESLRFLAIGGCENLEHLCEDIQGLKKLQKLLVISCTRLKSLPQRIKELTALEELAIADCENLDLSLEGNRDSARFGLRKLLLSGLSQLVDFPQWLLQGSENTLQHLVIDDCENLKELPQILKNIKSLQQLKVWNCSNELLRRCKKEKGEDWHKILHIPKINIEEPEDESEDPEEPEDESEESEDPEEEPEDESEYDISVLQEN